VEPHTSLPQGDSVNVQPLHVVTGAFGFTGYFISRRLLAMGARVRTLTRNPARPNPFGDQVSVAAYNFERPDQLARNLDGAAVLYNTYWVRFARGGVTFETAVANTQNLLRACEAAGVPRIVHLSVTNASEHSPLPYFRGKGLVEQAIKGSRLSYAILRPPIVFGPGDILVNNIAWFLRRFPLFAVMGDGRYRLQCVYVQDLAEIAVAAASRTDRVVSDAVGPETFSFEEFVRCIAAAIGSPAKIVHLSPGSVRGLLGILGVAVRDVVLTPDEITGLMQELLVSQNPPLGRTRFRDWLARAAGTLGTTYASEMDRHYRCHFSV
jgi:nucleoside-diphosphate-sugar epimerase